MIASDLETVRKRVQGRYGFPAGRPTDAEAEALFAEAAVMKRRLGRDLTDKEWDELVSRHVPYSGVRQVREGVDFSDLNALLALVAQRAEALRNRT